jgi:hypothetical protein
MAAAADGHEHGALQESDALESGMSEQHTVAIFINFGKDVPDCTVTARWNSCCTVRTPGDL